MRMRNFFKNWAILTVGMLLILALSVPIVESLTIKNNADLLNTLSNDDFAITIHRIREEDEIDPWPHGEPDWQLRMYVKGIRQTYECVGSDVYVDETFVWPGIITDQDELIDIKFELLDLDSGIWPDLHDIADISACIDYDYQEGDYDDTDDFDSHRPAVFKRTYNLTSGDWEPVDDDNDYLNIEYQQPLTWYVTSGNYDGSTIVDENDATVWFNIFVGNTPPCPPEKPSGITFGWQGMLYEFSTKSFDSDGDLIQIAWDWDGDGDIDELTGFHESWETVTTPHIWTMGQIYYIKAMAIDEHGLSSGWSEPHKVRINAPGGINGVEIEEWTLGHVYCMYYNHQKTQEIISMLRSGGNIVTALSTLVTAIATACGIPLPYAIVFTIVTAIIRLGVEVINMLDKGMGIYWKHYIIEVGGVPIADFFYIWSQTAEGGEGKAPDGNINPNKPSEPLGRTRIILNREYYFSSVATDSDGDSLTYIFDWGDGNFDCSDLTPSGERVIMSHAWTEKGTYGVRVKAVDEWGQESEWSEIHVIKNTLSRDVTRTPFTNIVERFMEILELLKMRLQVTLNI